MWLLLLWVIPHSPVCPFAIRNIKKIPFIRMGTNSERSVCVCGAYEALSWLMIVWLFKNDIKNPQRERHRKYTRTHPYTHTNANKQSYDVNTLISFTVASHPQSCSMCVQEFDIFSFFLSLTLSLSLAHHFACETQYFAGFACVRTSVRSLYVWSTSCTFFTLQCMADGMPEPIEQ